MLKQRFATAIAALGITALVAGLLGGTGSAGAASADPAPHAGPAGVPVPVTLITGDRFMVGRGRDGRMVATALPDSSGRLPDYSVRYDRDELFVVPHDVDRLVPEVLDPQLFDVSELVAMGYDDRSRPTLPVIVQNAPGVQTLTAPAAIRTGTALSSIHATAATVDKAAAVRFGTALERTQQQGKYSPRSAGTTLGGIGRIWLDAKVDAASLDTNLTQIGAPAAWKSGLSGKGTTVTVLDSGVDSGHPDLAGKVVKAVNFSDSPDASDGEGHGTHVASLLAGGGAGSHGARRGVAYGASLLSGKVLGDDGTGQESWVIEGMQWASDQGSDVVNMSLSGPPTGVDDPVAAALDALTRTRGTLFVVSAGNTGYGRGTVRSPGIAPSALTVGAVDAANEPARFSSRGPTAGDYRLKPEITAPGVEIIGARAGARSGDLYTTMSGTSQAAPQVAGAAALLLQQHPDWGWDRVKNQLIQTATANDAHYTYDQGGGRLNLAAATTRTVSADVPTVDFGYLRFPHHGPRTQRVTLANAGDRVVTIDANTTLNAVVDGPSPLSTPAGMLTVSPRHVTVPARGTATVTVRLDPRAGEPGTYSGDLSFMDGEHAVLRLPVGFYYEPERYDVTVSVKDRHGAPYARGVVNICDSADVNHASYFNVVLDANGKAIVRAHPGWYAVLSRVETLDAQGNSESIALAGEAEVHVDRNISVVVDARKAEPVHGPVLAGNPTKVEQAGVYVSRLDDDRGGFTDTIEATPAQIDQGRVLVQPTRPVTHGKFAYTTHWRLLPTAVHSAADVYSLILEKRTVPAQPTFHLSRSDIAEFARLEVTYHGRGRAGTALEARFGYTRLAPVPGALVYHPVRVPTRRVEMVTSGADQTWDQWGVTTGSAPAVLFSRVTDYRPGERAAVHWFRTLQPEILNADRDPGVQVIDTGIGDGEHAGPVDATTMIGPRLRLTRNQQVVGDEASDFGRFPIPGSRARFGAEQQIGYDTTKAPLPAAGHTTWTFTSAPSADPAQSASSVPSVVVLDYRPALSLLGTAAAGSPLPIDLEVRHIQGASAAPGPARTARLWFSTDAGESWRSLHLDRIGAQRFRAVVPAAALRSGGSVSLRATAVDAGDQRIDQTVIGMFPVR